MTKGGKREGAGRPHLPPEQLKKRRVLYLTDAEHERLQELLRALRSKQA